MRRVSIPGRVLPKTQKMVLDAALINTQHYKARTRVSGANQGIQKRPPLHLCVVADGERGSGSPKESFD